MRPSIARIAIVACLAAATVSYGALDKHVTLVVEGKPVAVRTYGGTVGSILQRAGVEVGPKDLVTPTATTKVRDGQTVEVRRAKAVTILLNGKPRREIVTGLTIQEVLAEVDLRLGRADRVHPSRASRVRPGMTISYAKAKALKVIYDGDTEQVVTNATSVGSVVKELGIKVGKNDRIEPSRKTLTKDGMTIRILRVGIRTETESIRRPKQTIIRTLKSLEYGQRKVIQVGRDGLERRRWRVRYVDGRVAGRRLLSVTAVVKRVDRIIGVGSAYPGCSCDAGSQTGKGTWYSQADGMTAAHRTLPMGTVVRVTNLANGKSVNVTIRDRGPYGDNRIIDLSDEAFRKIASLSAGVINVRIRW